MKIRIALLEMDKNYLQRLLVAFETKYQDKIEMYSFTDAELALDAVINTRINIFLASDKFEIDVEKIPDKCGFAYLVDSLDNDVKSGVKTICKFQKVDLIYKEIVGLHSENALDITKQREDGGCRLIVFTSPAGGTGTSSAAAACAITMAKRGKKTLHFTSEELGTSDTYFSGEGQSTVDDLIYAVKSKKGNMALKFESTVKQDASGVYFFASGSKALDWIDLKEEEIKQLLNELVTSQIFDVIVWDMDFAFSNMKNDILQMASDVVMVSDGSEVCNSKFRRMYESVEILERQRKVDVLDKTWVVYNKFSNKTGRTIGIEEIKEMGGAPKYEHATTKQIIEQLVSLNVFDKLVLL